MRKLTPEEENIIIYKGTETPFTGKYLNNKENGIYTCRQCGMPLYKSNDKFESDCGWPSFDNAIDNNVKEVPDADGKRVEIICNNCQAHLGHVFRGENMTEKNVRYCVNSISMDFIPTENIKKTILAGGCFWGMEELIRRQPGIINTDVVYAGGDTENPTYENHKGYTEAVLIEYNDRETDFKKILDFFFQVHDPTTYERQGNDIGESYKSIIFYQNEEEKKIAEDFINIVNNSGRWDSPVVTELKPLEKYYLAEDYHQDYLQKNPDGYTCHFVRDGGSYVK